MNKTAIEWTDFTWNPVTGCWGPGGTAKKPNRCPYCYAHRLAGRLAKMNRNFMYLPPGTFKQLKDRDEFTPYFWGNRLSEPAKVKKSSKIFVCSMADLLGDWVPDSWIVRIFDIIDRCPQHIFQLLTKNPKRYLDWRIPPNCWVGTTVTNQADADERLPWLLQVDAPVRFVSHEPLLGEIDVRNYPLGYQGTLLSRGIGWAIIGAMTGAGAVKPKDEWVSGLIRQYRTAGVPCFVKDSLYKDFPVREWPL